MAVRKVVCGQPVPAFQAGDEVVFAGNCRHQLSAVITVAVPNVTFRGEPGAILDFGRRAANAFYLRDASDGVVIRDLQIEHTTKSVIYARLSVFTIERVTVRASGSDDQSGGFLDHGIYIDGGVGWRLVDFAAVGISGHGVQVYSGSGSPTTGTIVRLTAAGNGGDGLHLGAASKDVAASEVLLAANGQWGVRSYKGTGHRVCGYAWANARGPVRQDVPLAECRLVEGAPGATAP